MGERPEVAYADPRWHQTRWFRSTRTSREPSRRSVGGGWGRGIRTPIDGTKNRCPAIGRYPIVHVREQTLSLQNANAEPF